VLAIWVIHSKMQLRSFVICALFTKDLIFRTDISSSQHTEVSAQPVSKLTVPLGWLVSEMNMRIDREHFLGSTPTVWGFSHVMTTTYSLTCFPRWIFNVIGFCQNWERNGQPNPPTFLKRNEQHYEMATIRSCKAARRSRKNCRCCSNGCAGSLVHQF